MPLPLIVVVERVVVMVVARVTVSVAAAVLEDTAEIAIVVADGEV